MKIVKDKEVTFVGALYLPPAPLYLTSDLLEHVEGTVSQIQQDFPRSHIILAGDLNAISDSEVVIRTGLTSTVSQATRGNSKLDRLYVSDLHFDGIRVVKSSVKSDHQAIVAYSGGIKTTVGKTRRTLTFRKHTSEQHAAFLNNMAASAPATFNVDIDNPQASYDQLYAPHSINFLTSTILNTQ